ncbi:MAG TPA: TonB-dependent receptor, partial [Steroidobacteraceae bacterium]
MTSREARSSHSRSRAVRKQVLAAFAGLITLPLSAFSMDLNQQVNFNIPAQDLAGALIQFSKQAGVQVIISEDLTGQTTPGISGARTIRQALGELLAPTGLGYRVAGETSITIGKGMTTQLLKEGDDGSASVSAATAAPERSLIRLAQGDLAHGVDAGRSSDPHRRVEPVQEEVVVTGTNIRGAASTAQVITIDREIIDQSGRGSIGRVLETVPQFFGGGQNIGVRGATSRANDLVAASSPNLRGLGSGSTLTLVNGRRLALSSGVGGADISAIPMGAIDRIEILTDGASAIYGSDAVGGVVNVILRKDYDGMETRALVGQSTYGDGTQWQVSQLAGTAWGSGNLLFHYEYDK